MVVFPKNVYPPHLWGFLAKNQNIFEVGKIRKNDEETVLVFSVIPPADYFPPVKAVATATSVFTGYVFCKSVDSAHNSQTSSPSTMLTACAS